MVVIFIGKPLMTPSINLSEYIHIRPFVCQSVHLPTCPYEASFQHCAGFAMLNDNMTVIDELQRIQRKAAVALFKALFQNLPGEMEKNYEESHIQPVAQGQISYFPPN